MEEAIREVRAQKSGSAEEDLLAHSQRGQQQQPEYTASDTHTAGSQPAQDKQRPTPQVSSVKNRVRTGSQEEAYSRALSSKPHSTAALQSSAQHHGRLGADSRSGQESSARLSNKHWGLRLMTPEGAGAELLSSADAAGASADPRPPQAVPAAVTQLQPGPRPASASEAGRPLPGSSGTQAPSGQGRGAAAVLVGEDEEFSVSPGQLCPHYGQCCLVSTVVCPSPLQAIRNIDQADD